MTIDAVALLRIPGFTPSDDADVRELDDGLLLFLDVPYESAPEVILDAIDDAIGEAIFAHADPRGIFVFADAAEPEEATTYDGVLDAVGDEGAFVSLGTEAMGAPEEMLGQMLEALGVGGDVMSALRSGDPDAMKLAQVQMMSAMERAIGADGHTIEVAADEPEGDAAAKPALGAKSE